MIRMTQAAVDKLKALLIEHPEEQVVRVTVKDIDEHRLTFGLTLEEAPQPEDEIQEIEGLTVTIEAQSAKRMDGMTVDYSDPGGFRFLHPEPPDDLMWKPASLN